MSDSLNLLQEPQKFCLAQAFKKKKKKKQFILVLQKKQKFCIIFQASISSPSHSGSDIQKHSCQTWVGRNQAGEKQQLM